MAPKAKPKAKGQGGASKEQLSEELSAKELVVNDVEERLRQQQAVTQSLRKRIAQDTVEKRRMAGEREAALEAKLASGSSEVEALVRAVKRTKEAIEEIETQTVQDLYYRWKRALEAHLRHGGTVEDLDVDKFLFDEYGATPQEKVEAAVGEAERCMDVHADLETQRLEAERVVQQLSMERLGVERLRQERMNEIKHQKSSNLAWWRSSLTELSRGNEFREEAGRLEALNDNLALQISSARRQLGTQEVQVAALKAEEAALERRQTEMSMQIREQQELLRFARVREYKERQRVEAKQKELAQLVEVPIWRWEVVQAGERCDGLREKREKSFLRVDIARNQAEELAISLGELKQRIDEEQRRVDDLEESLQKAEKVVTDKAEDILGLQRAYRDVSRTRDRSQKLLRTMSSVDIASPQRGRSASPREYEATALRSHSRSPQNCRGLQEESSSGRRSASPQELSRSHNSGEKSARKSGTTSSSHQPSWSEGGTAAAVPRPVPIANRRRSL